MDHVRHLEAYDFQGSLDVDVADKWMKRVIKLFELIKLTNVEKMDNVYRLVQGKANSWFDGIRRRYRVGVTWN